ncbi:MAG: hypothetical protein CVV41_16390 [Candidatus Riflebacteria bacterium HGW-Riflebacteria-1]|nr:MAG: hypothetical protein CVV41_16390 [Candidatus Riflebacteria bacterium HGW-Riflebacteria-1]
MKDYRRLFRSLSHQQLAKSGIIAISSELILFTQNSFTAKTKNRAAFVIANDYDAQDVLVPGRLMIRLLFRWLLWPLAIRVTYPAVLNLEWLAVRAAYPAGLPGAARPGVSTSTKTRQQNEAEGNPKKIIGTGLRHIQHVVVIYAQTLKSKS